MNEKFNYVINEDAILRRDGPDHSEGTDWNFASRHLTWGAGACW
jgi:hypothetical protein